VGAEDAGDSLGSVGGVRPGEDLLTCRFDVPLGDDAPGGDVHPTTGSTSQQQRPRRPNYGPGPDSGDLELLQRLERTFDPATLLIDYDVARFKYPFAGAQLVRGFLLEPSVDIDGHAAGGAGDNQKTIVPHEGRAKIDVRMVPDMTVEGTTDCVRPHIERRGLAVVVQMRVRSGYPWSKNRIDDLAKGR
jgi:hypothetical protein